MNKKVLYSFFVSFILLIAVIIIDRRSFNEMKAYTSWVNHSREVISSLERLSNHLKSAEIYSPNYETTSEKDFYRLYKVEAQNIENDLIHIQKLVNGDADQNRRMNVLITVLEKHKDVLANGNIIEMMHRGEGWRLKDLFGIHDMINKMIEHEKLLLRKRQDDLQKYTSLTGILTVLFSVIAVIIIGFTFLSNVFLSRKHQWLEGFLESILDTSQNGILTFIAVRENEKIVDFKIEFANKAIEQLLGIKPQAVIGKKLLEIPSYVRRPEIYEKYIEVVETGKQIEFDTVYKQGDIEKWFYVILAKRKDGLTATFHDISELKKYQHELQENIEQLQQSNNELEQYAYVASHDLQEPLRKIRTFASQLHETQGERVDDRGKQQIEKILNASERMSNLIRDILSFSSLKKEEFFKKTELNEVVGNVLQDLELLMVQKQAKIEATSLPAIEAIPLQMHQLFYNLLHNALKFSRPDILPVIQIRSEQITAKDLDEYPVLFHEMEYCKIIVQDNGLGFDEQYAEQIFGLFKRLTDKQKFTGSGIGLALCRKVVINHNGVIYATGEENKGATFYIILPLQQRHP
jgi:PAS domain S-box-containing protein